MNLRLKTYVILVTLLSACIVAYFIIQNSNSTDQEKNAIIWAFNDPAIKEFIEKSESSEGDEEDPQGRITYELLRHQNPLTGKVPGNMRNKELAFSQDLASARNARVGSVEDIWTLTGPSNLGGRTRAIALDVSDQTQKIIFAGGVTGGMWRSEDSGKSWAQTTLPNQLHSVSCIAQDTRVGHQQVWYYGTGEMVTINDLEAGLLKGNGIFKSIDGGKSWNILPSTQTDSPQIYDSSFDYTWNIVIDNQNTDQEEIYVAASGGIYRSTNGGGAWQRVLGTGNTSGRYTDIAITSNGTLYATLSNINGTVDVLAGIYRSVDGIAWDNITPTWWPTVFNRVVLGTSASNNNKLYVLADISTSSQNASILAQYNVNVWKDLSENLPDYTYNTGDYSSQFSFCMYIKVKPDDDKTVFLGGINLYRSTDGFSSKTNTWIGGYDPDKTDLSKYANHHPDQHALIFFNDANKMLSAHDGGVSITSNNTEAKIKWESLNAGYFTTQFYSVAMNNSKANDVVIGGMQDNGTYGTNTIKGLEKWESLLAGDGSFSAISNNGKRYYVSSQYGRIFRLDFKDDGKYAGFTRVDPEGEYDYLFVNPFVLDPVNSNIMYLATGHNIYRNDNLTGIPVNSNRPTALGWEIIQGTETDGIISAVAVSSYPGNVLYYGTSNGNLYRVDQSNTQNATRTEVTGIYFPKYFGNPTGYISSIGIDPFDANKVLVTFSNYEIRSIFYTEDGGITWTNVGGNLEQNLDGSGNGPAVYWTAMLHLTSTTKYFVATSIGLFTTDKLQGNQTIWESNSSIGAVPVYMIQARQKDGRVLAATHGNGIYRIEFPDALPPLIEPLSVSLSQNYPNPFIGSTGTKITFSIDEQLPVVLKVYNSEGKEIATLINNTLKAGSYVNDFNSASHNLSAGIYFYRIQVGNYKKTMKMIVN